MKMRRKSIVVAVVCLASGILASSQSDGAADLPYAGTWKLNLAKSDFVETTVTYEQTASGHMQFTAAGQSYTFQMDGKDYPSLFGGTAAWKQTDATTWEIALKQNGKLINTTTTTLQDRLHRHGRRQDLDADRRLDWRQRKAHGCLRPQ